MTNPDYRQIAYHAWNTVLYNSVQTPRVLKSYGYTPQHIQMMIDHVVDAIEGDVNISYDEWIEHINEYPWIEQIYRESKLRLLDQSSEVFPDELYEAVLRTAPREPEERREAEEGAKRGLKQREIDEMRIARERWTAEARIARERLAAEAKWAEERRMDEKRIAEERLREIRIMEEIRAANERRIKRQQAEEIVNARIDEWDDSWYAPDVNDEQAEWDDR